MTMVDYDCFDATTFKLPLFKINDYGCVGNINNEDTTSVGF